MNICFDIKFSLLKTNQWMKDNIIKEIYNIFNYKG